MGKQAKRDGSALKVRQPGRRGAVGKLTLLLLTTYVLFCMMLAGPASSYATLIPSGANTVDTVLRDDMTAAYYLGSGSSQITVVDPANGQVLYTIPLTGIPANTTTDIDWNKSAQRLIVTTNTGMVLSVDPATSTFAVVVNLPANNYTISCAENWTTAGTFGWAVDSVTGWLHQILTAGTAVPVGAMPIGTNIELAEKRWYPGATTAQDGFLLGLGVSAAGQTNVDVFDRSTGFFMPLATWATMPANATGIASIKGPDAYVSANSPMGPPGYLLHMNLATNTFSPTATYTFNAETTFDVASAGIFVTVLTNGAGGGSRIQLFDMGDPTVPMLAGYQPSSTNAPGGGMSAGGT